MFEGTYQGKRVFLTGHTGFKGAWLSLWLHTLGAKLFGYALPPRSSLDLYGLLPKGMFEREWLADIRNQEQMRGAIEESNPDLIIHMAAQPLVRESYAQPLETFSVNAWGTALLLDTVRELEHPAPLLIVTSDKCYRNEGHGRPFREGDALGGDDPYSMSKAAAELVASSWQASFFARNPRLGTVATVRAGNVIGGGDYAADRIVPDCVRAQLNRTCLTLRNPGATRPWQHVLECLGGYLTLGRRLLTGPADKKMISLNFGPAPESERTVQELATVFFDVWPGKWEISPDANAVPEASRLTLSSERAAEELNWGPVWRFDVAVRNTALWYQARHGGDFDAAQTLALTQRQISDYESAASRGRGEGA